MDGSVIKFEPDFKDFEVVLLNTFDVMIKAVAVIPRIETKLYTEWVGMALASLLLLNVNFRLQTYFFLKILHNNGEILSITSKLE